MDFRASKSLLFISCCQSGAKNLINACRECKVKQLIYNSSADVIFDGSHHIRNGDESMHYPWKVCSSGMLVFIFVVWYILLCFGTCGFLSVLMLIQYADMLTEMKAQAEALILSANDFHGLLTCALRPSNVFGPTDTCLVQFLVTQANSIWAKVW